MVLSRGTPATDCRPPWRMFGDSTVFTATESQSPRFELRWHVAPLEHVSKKAVLRGKVGCRCWFRIWRCQTTGVTETAVRILLFS